MVHEVPLSLDEIVSAFRYSALGFLCGIALACGKSESEYFCTYSDVPLNGADSREQYPVNCVSWHAASTFCSARGKMLPSEAEFEYMASGLRSRTYVWGEETGACGDAVWGRFTFGYDQCLPTGDPGGPLPPGRRELDKLKLQEGQVEVLDLAGNVSEWTRDYWNRRSEPCWSDWPLLDNPQCVAPSPLDGDLRTIKGFPWNVYILPAAFRAGRDPSAKLRFQTGFRCVRPAR